MARKQDGYSFQEYTVEDYRGNKYEARMYFNQYKKGYAISADYDLACLYFDAENCLVETLPIATENPTIGEDVVLLGAPKNQANCITFGQVVNYTTVALNETSAADSNVKFEVIGTNAASNNGSSGGPLLDFSLNVVGVLYAGNSALNNSFSIPIVKVWEFLNLYI